MVRIGDFRLTRQEVFDGLNDGSLHQCDECGVIEDDDMVNGLCKACDKPDALVCDCGEPMVPFSLTPAWVGIRGKMRLDEDGVYDYVSEGWSETVWEDQTIVGHGCKDCGDVHVDKTRLALFIKGIAPDFLKPATRITSTEEV